MAVTAHLKESARLPTLGSVIKTNVVWAMQVCSLRLVRLGVGWTGASFALFSICHCLGRRPCNLLSHDG